MGVGRRGNAVLGALLGELGWSLSQLAEVINDSLGPGSVGRSTVSDWVHHDRVPRDPLPTVVAHLLSDALDREVPVAQVWSGRAQPAEFWVPADAELRLPWTTMGTVEVLDDWLRHTGGTIGMDRRIFLAVSGATLTGPAWDYVDRLATRGASFATLASERCSITVTSAMVDTVAATTASIRRLGDVEGGNADNLRFVHHHLTWVAKLLRQARFTSAAVADRLLAEWAQLAQVAAWMANDARQYGLCQRYFISGLRAAHTAGDRSIGTLLLAEMGQARVHQGRLGDGVDLGRAARDAVELANAAYEAARATPVAMRALAASRFAMAQAAVGNARGFHATAEEARALLDTPGALDTRPPYLGWFGPASLEGFVAQGTLTLAAATSRDSRALVGSAEQVLGRRVTDPGTTPRIAVFHAVRLARAHLATGDLDRAVPTAQLALRRLATVRSQRCSLVLRRLEEDLAAVPPSRRPASLRSLQDQLRSIHAEGQRQADAR
ncbi:MAG: hypothetical protein ACRDRX_08670 [Pseudonocardiaceae bacterium]